MTGTILLILRVLLLAGLYAFVVWAIYTLWRDLKRQSATVAFLQTPGLSLETTGPDPIEPISCRFAKPEIVIGRDQACDCPLDDKTVSNQHARLSFHHQHWWVEDLGSTNGTYLNGERVSSSIVVTSGDELRCGQVHLAISIGEPGEQTV